MKNEKIPNPDEIQAQIDQLFQQYHATKDIGYLSRIEELYLIQYAGEGLEFFQARVNESEQKFKIG